ncbi:MAG: hypothetical protein EOO73_19765 [Myxococcales bacterium]|nr:MAG: hypothetical protein EOO73_19765 [Myxococcales bacterium]
MATFLGVANLTLTAFSLPQARANAEEAVKQSGLALLQQLGPTLVGPPQVVTINGQRMSLASKMTPLDVPEVLGRFERYCHDDSGGIAEEFAAVPEVNAHLQKLPQSLRDPASWFTTRQEAKEGDSGQVTCIARKDAGGGLQGVLDRSLAFMNTGDLAELGDARYFVARKDPKSGHTHVLAMWTEGSFNILKMFTGEGDSPGSDSREVPRPPASRRVLTAEVDGHPYALRMYDTNQSHAQVLSFYERELASKGYAHTALPVDEESELNLNDHVGAFAKGSVAVIVVTNQTPAEQTGVTLIEMGGPGFAQATAHAENPLE